MKVYMQKFSTYILRSTFLLAVFLIAYMVEKRDFSQANYNEILHFGLYYIFPVLFFSFIFIGISFIKKPIQTVTLVYMGAIIFAIYAAEIYLQYTTIDYKSNITRAAQEHKYSYDERNMEEVLSDLSRNTKAYPFFTVRQEYKDLLPLGNIPDVLTVHCNELGQYMKFVTDRHGFNNPNAIWNEESVDIVALGDSYTQGSCMPENNGFVNMIRNEYSSIINLAIGGNNPQANLAAMIEYALPKRPKYILWFHYAGNDLSGMTSHKGHQMYNKYIYEDFLQNLIQRENEVEGEMLKFYEENKHRILNVTKKSIYEKIILKQVLKLHYLRAKLGQSRNLDDVFDFSLFHDIMKKAKETAKAANSKLIFVNIPALGQAFITDSDPNYRKTYDTIHALGIEWLDISPAIISLEDPSGLYAFRDRGGHFSYKGNRLVADVMLEKVLSKSSLIHHTRAVEVE